MQYTLMHKDVPVADMILDEASGTISRIEKVYHPEHLPVGVAFKREHADRAALNAWWVDRSIPASRSGIRKAMETLNVPNTLTNSGVMPSSHQLISALHSLKKWLSPPVNKRTTPIMM